MYSISGRNFLAQNNRNSAHLTDWKWKSAFKKETNFTENHSGKRFYASFMFMYLNRSG